MKNTHRVTARMWPAGIAGYAGIGNCWRGYCRRCRPCGRLWRIRQKSAARPNRKSAVQHCRAGSCSTICGAAWFQPPWCIAADWMEHAAFSRVLDLVGTRHPVGSFICWHRFRIFLCKSREMLWASALAGCAAFKQATFFSCGFDGWSFCPTMHISALMRSFARFGACWPAINACWNGIRQVKPIVAEAPACVLRCARCGSVRPFAVATASGLIWFRPVRICGCCADPAGLADCTCGRMVDQPAAGA